MENLRHFLHFLERKKIINITEVVQDKAKIQSLVQEIIKIDFKDFNKANNQNNKRMRASSGSDSTGSQTRMATRRRQGTPVNMNTTGHQMQPTSATSRQDSASLAIHEVALMQLGEQSSSAEHVISDSPKSPARQ